MAAVTEWGEYKLLLLRRAKKRLALYLISCHHRGHGRHALPFPSAGGSCTVAMLTSRFSIHHRARTACIMYCVVDDRFIGRSTSSSLCSVHIYTTLCFDWRLRALRNELKINVLMLPKRWLYTCIPQVTRIYIAELLN